MKISREIKVMYDVARERMPRDVLAALAPEEIEAFFEHREYFGRLAIEATHPDIKRYLQRIAGQDIFWLMLYSKDEAPYQVYFHHTIIEAADSFQIRLPNMRAAPANLPDQLRPVYRSLGGLRREHGGLVAPEDIRSVSDGDYWISEENTFDPANCFLFYDFGDGDMLGFTSVGEGVLYEHEVGVLSPADLGPFVSEGFHELLAPPDR